MAWTVIFTGKAERDLEKLPDDISKRIILKMEGIAQDNSHQRPDRMANSPCRKIGRGHTGEQSAPSAAR